ncbi:hypothetical protein GCM10009060_24650 [Halorubrum trapanicum]
MFFQSVEIGRRDYLARVRRPSAVRGLRFEWNYHTGRSHTDDGPTEVTKQSGGACLRVAAFGGREEHARGSRWFGAKRRTTDEAGEV